MTRVAVVRGPFLNPYEMGPYKHLGPGFDLVAVAARRCFTESDATGLEVRRLRCVETELSVRRGKLINMGPWFLGFGYWMPGLDRAVADADLIHTAETYFGFSLQSARAARKRNRPLVVTVKETIPEIETVHPIRRHGREGAVKAEVRAATALFLATSTAAATALEMEGVDPHRIEVIPPAVDASRFLRPQRRFGDPAEILFVGPAIWRKGLLEAVRGLSLVLRRMPARLNIVGVGADLGEAMRVARELGIEDAIRLFPRQPYADMPERFREVDLLLAPSIPTRTWQEQDSMAVVEAMAAGLPVVATPGGIRRELLGDEGYWCAPGDYIDLAERVVEACAQPEEAMRRGAILKARALEVHDVAVIGGRLAAAYRRVLE